jgi:hypothetical protein
MEDGFGGNLFLLEEINKFQTRNRQHFSSRPYDNNESLNLQADVEVPKGTKLPMVGRVQWSDGSARTAL